jgi:hypothetical protein
MPFLLDSRRCGACKKKSAESGTSLFALGYSASVSDECVGKSPSSVCFFDIPLALNDLMHVVSNNMPLFKFRPAKCPSNSGYQSATSRGYSNRLWGKTK